MILEYNLGLIFMARGSDVFDSSDKAAIVNDRILGTSRGMRM